MPAFPQTHPAYPWRSPPLPGGSVGGLKASHDADLDWHTIIPPHSGDRLDLRMAIWICFHNIKVQAQRREQEQRTQAQQRELEGCAA